MLDDHDLANALEALLRSEAWQAVRASLISDRENVAAVALGLGTDPLSRAEAAGAYHAFQTAIDAPGLLLERLR